MKEDLKPLLRIFIILIIITFGILLVITVYDIFKAIF